MKRFDLQKDFVRGWIVGHFVESIFQTDKFEIAIKHFKSGDVEKLHYHKLTKEITVIISGKVEMCNQMLVANDIIMVEPNEKTSFTCIEDAVTVAVRDGSYPQDKFEIDESEQNN